MRRRRQRHGFSYHPSYRSWVEMMRRCYDPTCDKFEDYGAVKIDVCARWHDLANFIKDMGERPVGYVIDRIDNSKGYSPENCRWLSKADSNYNRTNLKLTWETVQKIRKLRSEGNSLNSIAREFRISMWHLLRIIHNERWNS